MSKPEPFVRKLGTGPPVICIHANASTSGQWRSLMELLAPRHEVLAPDCYGSGQSPDWPSDLRISLHDELEFLEPVFARVKAPFALVGHSYGGAVALLAALAHRSRARALAVYEPTLFSLIDAESGAPNGTDEIRAVVADASEALNRGDSPAAAERFIDYWMGIGTWRQIPEDRQPSIASSIRNIRRWSHALLTEPTPLNTFKGLAMPILYMVGGRSTISARGVAKRLLPALPNATRHEFPELGHMGPVTHPAIVNGVLEQFLREA